MFAGGTCLSSIHVKYRTCGFPAEHRQEHSTASVGLSSFDSVSCCHLSSRKMMCTQPDVHVKIKENWFVDSDARMLDVDVFSSGYMGQHVYSQRSAASCDALCSDTFISKAALRFLATHRLSIMTLWPCLCCQFTSRPSLDPFGQEHWGQ